MYAPIPMLPGPVTLHPDVLIAMGNDYGSGQYNDTFMSLYTATSQNIAKLMGTHNDVILMTGEGMLALWSALKSCLKPEDHVISIDNGVFGSGIGDMALSLGCIVEKISFPYDSTLHDLTQVEEAIRRLNPVMLTAVHCETPSGTLNPLNELGQLKKDLAVPLFYVDAVSSLGGVPIYADEWHIDLLLAGSQKCLSAPPNMSMISVSQTAWDYIKKVKYQGYDALLPFKTIYHDKRCPYTPYWHGIAALYAATQVLFRENLENVYNRHHSVAIQCRSGLKELGIKLWTNAKAINSPTVTAAIIPKNFSWSKWKHKLAHYGLICAGSFGPMSNTVFRLGHMGTQAQSHLMAQALEAIASALS